MRQPVSRVFALCLTMCLALIPLAQAKKGPYYAVPDPDKIRSDLATLVLPEAIDIQMVDGIEYPGFKNLVRRGDIVVKVLPGEREVALKYNQLFEWGSGEHEMVRSKVLVLGFVAEAGKTYRVEHDRFRNVEEARAGVQNLSLRLKDEAGNSVVFGAVQVNRNWKGEETVMKRTDLVSPDAAAAAMAARAAAPVTEPALTGALEALKFSWQNASDADRAAFRAWINTVPAP